MIHSENSRMRGGGGEINMLQQHVDKLNYFVCSLTLGSTIYRVLFIEYQTRFLNVLLLFFCLAHI